MKTYTFNNREYELFKDYREAFNFDEVVDKFTEYFEPYDYVLGDWSYGKLRLKGFCDDGNPLYKKINDIQMVEKYIVDNCAYDCKHFILKRAKNETK